MVLSPKDQAHLFSLWLPMINFANKQMNIFPDAGEISEDNPIDLADSKVIHDKLWANNEIFSDFVKEHPDLSSEDKKIVLSWKTHIHGTFIFERNLKKGAAFLHSINHEDVVFIVVGRTDPLIDTFFPHQLPIILDATLMPFKNVIVTDGIYETMPMVFGGGAKQAFKENYLDAKKAGRIYTRLDQVFS